MCRRAIPRACSKGQRTVTADKVSDHAIDALFDDVAPDGPGAAVGIYHRGQPPLIRNYGLADLESGLPINSQTPFHSASVSKQFTAFAIALLAREGAVDLDTDVRDYLPYVPEFGDAITVRHLILHTSGLRNQITLLLLGGQGVEGRTTQQHVVNLVASQKTLSFPPGTDYSYSNTGYVLLAEIVFAVTGRSLREFTAERIFEPLGMRHTFFADDVTEIVPHRASSYTRRRGEDGRELGGWARALLNCDNVGSSGLSTTVEDLARWAGNFVEPVVGDEELVQQICTSGALDDGTSINYGYGLERSEIAGCPAVSHSGSDAAFRSVFAYFPEQGFSVAILANTELALTGKVAAIAELLLPEADKRFEKPPAADAGADLSSFEGIYVPEHDISRRLEVIDGVLFHRWGSRDPQKLTVRGDGTLDLASPGRQSFSPAIGENGKVLGLTVPRPGIGRPQFLRRVSRSDAPFSDLTEYVGNFRCPELDITYSVAVEADGLVMRHLWSNRPTATLSPVLADRFESDGDRLAKRLAMVLVFRRDSKNRIDGMLMHTGGDRNISFDRVGDARSPGPVASTRAQLVWG